MVVEEKGKKTPTSKNKKSENQNNAKNSNKQEDEERCLEKSTVSLHWNQSDAYMILLNTADITGLKISKIGT